MSRQLPEAVCDVAVERNIEVPAGDGVTLLTDHYIPLLDGPRPTLLVRTPYGRGFPWDYVYGALFARQGFHVVLQSCRGTAGSGGERDHLGAGTEAADGQAAVAWLRRQDWFTGALGTVGASYLGFTQWALATDPPPELGAMVIQVSSDDFQTFVYPGGAFALEAMLVATAAYLSMDRGFAKFVRAMLRMVRHYRRAERTLPLIDAYPAVLGQRAGFFEEWLYHPEAADPFWDSRRATAVPALIPPTHLLTGWWDECLDPTLGLYRRLREGGREVRLVVGPWNHASGFSSDMPVVLGEALGWLRGHLDGDRAGLQRSPVRVHVGEIGGRGGWRDLPGWPPPGARQQQWHLHGDGTLAAGPDARAAVSSLHYDPAAPTPSVGGPTMNSRTMGPQRNNKLEARPDVLVFTGPVLSEPVEVIGPVSIRLRVRASGPHFDVFARLCDVDPRGRSWNICDGLVRLGGGGQGTGPGTSDGGPGDGGWLDVMVPMSATAHRFGAGHRLRVQISGGAHPRFMRNTGTGDPLATATRLVPVDIEIGHGAGQPCVLSLLTC
jgi:putative CocE/NonD family hydrolase